MMGFVFGWIANDLSSVRASWVDGLKRSAFHTIPYKIDKQRISFASNFNHFNALTINCTSKLGEIESERTHFNEVKLRFFHHPPFNLACCSNSTFDRSNFPDTPSKLDKYGIVKNMLNFIYPADDDADFIYIPPSSSEVYWIYSGRCEQQSNSICVENKNKFNRRVMLADNDDLLFLCH